MDLFKKYLKDMVEDDFAAGGYFVPVDKLKPKVLMNALSTFAKDCQTESVIAFYDTSFWNRGKHGFLLSDDAIYVDRFLSAKDDGPMGDKINIRNLRRFAGMLNKHSLPLDFCEIPEVSTDDPTEISYVLLEYDDGKQAYLFANVYFENIKNILQIAVNANEKVKNTQKEIMEAAEAAYNQKDFRKAYHYYGRAYDAGIARGAYMCGYMYDHGIGVIRDDKLALEWYCKAAEMEDAHAQLQCAICYQLGYGGTVDEKESYRWMHRAADNGNAEAMRQCAKMCASGIGTAKDETAGFLWLEQAAYAGDVESQYLLGRVYEEGTYAKKDEVEALSWFKMAAKQNHTLAMAKCAVLYAQSNKIVKNYDLAVTYAEKALANGFHAVETLLDYIKQTQRTEHSHIALLSEKAEQGDENAMKALANLYLNENGHSFDITKGMYWMEKIADGGNVEMMVKCADLYNRKNIRFRNPIRAFQYYERAARLGHCKAQFMCALAYEKGEVTEVNYEKARYWYRKAADQGEAEAMHNLAILLLSGDGGERNYYESKRLFHKAAEMGVRQAQEVLDEFF